MPTVIVKAITSKLAGPIASIVALTLFIVCGALTLENRMLNRSLTREQNSVAQLKGTLQFQNLWVSQLGADSAAAKKRAESAVEASRRAHAGDAARVHDLLTAPKAESPAEACEQADHSILQFFNPQPEHST